MNNYVPGDTYGTHNSVVTPESRCDFILLNNYGTITLQFVNLG